MRESNNSGTVVDCYPKDSSRLRALTLNVSVQIKENNSRKRGPFGTSSLSFHPTLIGQRSLPFQNSPERPSSM